MLRARPREAEGYWHDEPGMRERAEIKPRGPFSLPAAAGFGFGPTEGGAPTWDGAMRLAFPVDGGRGHAGAVLRQPEPDGPLEVDLELRGGAAREAALAQVARTLSLDHDGHGFIAVGESDPAPCNALTMGSAPCCSRARTRPPPGR
jgi:hypothetical protein